MQFEIKLSIIFELYLAVINYCYYEINKIY